jgi:hypothetical protein
VTSETYLEGAVMHLPDVNGFPGVIHVAALQRIAEEANRSDNAVARYGRRLYDRDALNGALGLLDTCTEEGCDLLAPFDLRDARPRCSIHKKDS